MSNLSDKKAVIFTAPQSWGKTFHSAKLQEGLACTNLVDDWCPADGVTPGALHLTNCSPTELADWRKAIDDETLVIDSGWFYSAGEYFGPRSRFGIPSIQAA